METIVPLALSLAVTVAVILPANPPKEFKVTLTGCVVELVIANEEGDKVQVELPATEVGVIVHDMVTFVE